MCLCSLNSQGGRFNNHQLHNSTLHNSSTKHGSVGRVIEIFCSSYKKPRHLSLLKLVILRNCSLKSNILKDQSSAHLFGSIYCTLPLLCLDYTLPTSNVTVILIFIKVFYHYLPIPFSTVYSGMETEIRKTCLGETLEIHTYGKWRKVIGLDRGKHWMWMQLQ